MRYTAKRDENEREIVDALEACGASVQRLDTAGAPDLLVGYRNRNLLMEVKAPSELMRLTSRQKEWLAKWAGQWTVVTTPNEAIVILQEVAE